MNKAVKLYSFFFIFLIYHAQAQSIIKGKIVNDDVPVNFAQVYAQELDGKILTYAFTDSLGEFNLLLKTEKDSVLLQIARLGYKPVQKIISSTQKEITIQLSLADESTLKEVVITGGKPIEEQGDTIGYFVDSFSDGSEKNVEDLLAKLPGISVDEQSGAIKYQGKEIKKILLDGDDLTGENYKALSKNLSADWLEEVEILKHFTGSRLLQGIRQSDEVAINLKLKEDAKAPLFGTIEAGGGNTSKYLGRAELLSYLKKIKLFALVGANNTGDDLQTYDLATYTTNQLQYKGFILSESVIENQLNAPPFLKQERFTFHEGQFFSNSMVANISPKTSLRSFTSVYNNTLNFNFSDSLSYFLPTGGGFSFTQRQQQRQKPFEFFQDIKMETQLATNQDLIVRLQYKYMTDKPITSNFTGFEQFTDRSSIQTNEWFVGISYLNKLNQKWVNTLDFEVGNNARDEFFTLLEKNSQIDSIRQKTDQKIFNIGVFNYLSGIIKKNWFVNILAGWSFNRSDLAIVQNELLGNSQTTNTYSFNNLFSEFKIKKKIKALSLSFGGRIRNASIKFNNISSNDLYFEPTVSFSIKKNVGKIVSELKALYNIEYIFLKPNQLIGSSLLTNYRTMVAFNTNPDTPIRNEIGIGSIKLRENDVSFITANASWVYLRANGILVSQLQFQGVSVLNNQLQDGHSTSFFSSYSLDKYFSVIQSTIKVAYEYNTSETPLTIESQQATNTLSQRIFSVTSGSSITDDLSLSFSFKNHQSKSVWSGNENRFDYTNYYAKIVFKPLRLLRLTLDYQAINFRQSNDFSSIVNASVSYSILDDKLSFQVTGNNLTNRNSVVLSTNEPSVFSNSNYPLQARFLLMSAKYRF